MNLAQSLSFYITLNTLITFAFLITKIIFYFSAKFGFEVSSRAKLQISYWTIFIAMMISVMDPLIPKNDFFVPSVKVWSAESVKSFYSQYSESTENAYISFSVGKNPMTLKSQDLVSTGMFIGLILIIFASSLMIKDLILLFKIKMNSHLFKKMGRVSIFLNDQIQVPFSYFGLGANVIIPIQMITKMSDFKIALLHELQHHRQKDTLWVYILLSLKIICFTNPFLHLWIREIYEIQEFACDEALIGRKKVNLQSYASCLLEVAQNAIDQKSKLVCATGLTLLVERNLLKRRIEKMLIQHNDTKKSVKIALGFILGVALSVTAYASKSLVHDRRVSMKEALEFVQKAKVNSSFPIVVNDLVLQELNRYLGTPEGRDFMRKSLSRMETYRTLVGKKLQEYQVPEEIMAVPIIESGYQNLPQSENKSWGAGLWMFIENTARNYGLRVDSVIDERLNPEILTDAAMRYISANYFRFKDYQLAMLGYNIGESKVQEGINKLGRRDAWLLVRNGYEGDKYLARLMAAILIMKNPDSVK